MDPPDLDDNNTIIIPFRGRGSNRHNDDAAHRRQNWPLVSQLQPSHVSQRSSANRNVIFFPSREDTLTPISFARLLIHGYVCIVCCQSVHVFFKSKVNYAVLSLLIERGV
jgi:hypothetical protein